MPSIARKRPRSIGAGRRPPALARLLRQRRRGHVDNTQTRAAALAEALRTALTALAVRFRTTDQGQWQLPALRETYRDLGIISTVFGPIEMERQNRGSFNLVVDLGSPLRGEIVVPPGEAGTFTAADIGYEPPHLRDQLSLYEAFGYRRQPFTPAELEPPVTMETIPIVR